MRRYINTGPISTSSPGVLRAPARSSGASSCRENPRSWPTFLNSLSWRSFLLLRSEKAILVSSPHRTAVFHVWKTSIGLPTYSSFSALLQAIQYPFRALNIEVSGGMEDFTTRLTYLVRAFSLLALYHNQCMKALCLNYNLPSIEPPNTDRKVVFCLSTPFIALWSLRDIKILFSFSQSLDDKRLPEATLSWPMLESFQFTPSEQPLGFQFSRSKD